MSAAKSDACIYILTVLLQRMETEKPGLIPEIIDGIKSDQSNMSENINNKEHVESIFNEALTMLERAHSLTEQKNNA